jgi:hypothetical protein
MYHYASLCAVCMYTYVRILSRLQAKRDFHVPLDAELILLLDRQTHTKPL